MKALLSRDRERVHSPPMGSHARIRVVFFDVHGTLIYCKLSPQEIFTRLCQEAGIQISQGTVASLYPDMKTLEEGRSKNGQREDVFWLETNAHLLTQLGVPDPDQKLARKLAEGFKEVRWWHAYPEVKGTLRHLQELGYRLAVIANARKLVEDRLAHLGLTGYFETITYSEEAGFEKPHPEIFRIALTRMKCRAEEAVHIGDRLLEDVEGARSVGLHPILIDRGNLYPKIECDRIASLEELPNHLPVKT